jgi:hypothetical protein
MSPSLRAVRARLLTPNVAETRLDVPGFHVKDEATRQWLEQVGASFLDGFITDGSAVPGALTVNPAMTIAALAEGAVPGIVRAARGRGVTVEYGAPAPDGSTSGRRGVLSLATTLQEG